MWVEHLRTGGAALGRVHGAHQQTTPFSDALSAVRRWLWQKGVVANVAQDQVVAKLPEPLPEVLR